MKTTIAWIIHSILPAWIAKFFIEAPTMSDETPVVVPDEAPAPVVAEAAPVAVVVAVPVVAAPAPAVPAVNTDTLKALLLTLGHDIEAEWDHLVALAKKL
ncbi:hypothetical protein [Pseudomonas costantinii]|uniref:Uncharacterized protein n=2 Tax=Pseudomonas costantinii TaxID=168469 RepID=A0A1S2UEQ7_9PSED|nr:hypothetical protein [Pseudomonas costantinii]OIN44526.1 hypothetical protein BFL40_30020 [Pseudomonas costantinii]